MLNLIELFDMIYLDTLLMCVTLKYKINKTRLSRVRFRYVVGYIFRKQPVPRLVKKRKQSSTQYESLKIKPCTKDFLANLLYSGFIFIDSYILYNTN